MEKIDFVVAWVDGNDPEWRKEKYKYTPDSSADTRDIRYREWDILKYWFRSIEKNASWVNKVFFVTWGHVPQWLDVNNKKIEVINHKEFIPLEYLPTFSANPIELNLHRIKGLSNQFVFFNDDMFIIDKVKEKDFFYRGLPCDTAILNPHISQRIYQTHMEAMDMDIINDHFEKNVSIRKNIFKWFNIKYGKDNIKTLLLMPWKNFAGFNHHHGPTSFLKETYEEVWNKEYEALNETCMRKFRTPFDLNQWLIQGWQIASGKFYPRKSSFIKNTVINDDAYNNTTVNNYIKRKKYKVICVNDMVQDPNNFEIEKKRLIRSFEDLFPNKSSFEK